MRVNITYVDQDSFTVEEVVKQAVNNYGKQVQVEVMPESSIAYDHIYFGIQQLATHEQLSLLFEKNADYHSSLQKLRSQILYKLTEILDQVIVDNESKVS